MQFIKKLFRFGNKARRSLNFNFNQVGFGLESATTTTRRPKPADTHERFDRKVSKYRGR